MDVLDRSFTSGKVEELDGTPVFSLVSGPDRLLGLAAKRTIDVLGSAAALVLLSPLLLTVGLAIRLRDGSPILFRQTRVGLHGRPFDVVKFRTMTTDAEARYEEVVARSDARAFKLSDDPRVTRPGAFLRADEPGRAAPGLERAARPDEPGRPATGAAARGRGLRPLAPSPAAQ